MLLAVLAEQPKRQFGSSELARLLGVPKSSILNLCTAMLEGGFLRRGSAGYQLNHRFAELSTAYLKGVTEVEAFYATCQENVLQAAYTVQLGILGDGVSIIYLARHDGSIPLNLGSASEIGRRVPASCTAAGRALLASESYDVIQQRLPDELSLPKLTRHSISSMKDLRRELSATRKRGYALERGETVLGLTCFGMAVSTPHREDGHVGISFSYPDHASPKSIASAAADLRKFTGAFAERIGGTISF